MISNFKLKIQIISISFINDDIINFFFHAKTLKSKYHIKKKIKLDHISKKWSFRCYDDISERITWSFSKIYVLMTNDLRLLHNSYNHTSSRRLRIRFHRKNEIKSSIFNWNWWDISELEQKKLYRLKSVFEKKKNIYIWLF